MDAVPTSVVQSESEYSFTLLLLTLHITLLSVALSGLTVAVKVTVSPTVMSAELLSRDTPVTEISIVNTIVTGLLLPIIVPKGTVEDFPVHVAVSE